jgi:hypothetical protein
MRAKESRNRFDATSGTIFRITVVSVFKEASRHFIFIILSSQPGQKFKNHLLCAGAECTDLILYKHSTKIFI